MVSMAEYLLLAGNIHNKFVAKTHPAQLGFGLGVACIASQPSSVISMGYPHRFAQDLHDLIVLAVESLSTIEGHRII